MPRGHLTVQRINKISEPGRYADGNCLYLVVTETGAKQFVARITVHGKQSDLGLGGASYTTLEEAREECQRLRKIARKGEDPRIERRKEKLVFNEVARRVHENLRPTWRSEKHADKWIASIKQHVSPTLGDRPIDTIGTADILKVLTPIWTETHDTANRIKQRLASIFDWAKGAGHYPHENPLNGIKKALPTVKKRADHMAALPWQELPAFMQELSSREGMSARCLEFIILTAARSGEARGAIWDEIEGDIWTVPDHRMKQGLSHRVPLSPEAIDVLDAIRDMRESLVFPSRNRGKFGEARPQSDTVFKALMIRMKRDGLTTHGFRSTFRDWCSESAHADREVAEAALSHAVGNKVERAYARSDLFDRRRDLMNAWARFATGKSGDVVRLVR